MIEVAIIFIIGHDENGLFPNLGILQQNLHRLAHIPRPKPGLTRVIREMRAGHQPRNRRQSAVFNILTELVENTSPFGTFNVAFGTIIIIPIAVSS
jgi:hypothetical protein